ncbi:hypothetical protein [Jeotgalibacillus haloalkalitolerans]|uniref:Lipoprotein n=1 Tax=Jeotgalibacillus haloalkalitolerans TaxID=3104292 RepID=A0ABU5KN47_9BACL|nr:hypothetical protein [Jeotgalibacillus sp. HH7-29]MDZ5712685.1 hypothetical protein [Jeotgalibacillus sp. HH7-29]
MKKMLVLLALLSILLSGCTWGDPESYTIFIFEGESESWEGYMEYVDFSEGKHPDDYVELTFKEDRAPADAVITIAETDISQKLSFTSSSTMVTLNESDIRQLIELKKNEDNSIKDSIDVNISWEGEQETISMTFSTSVRRDGRDL